jgi:hypothetical protein
MNIFGHLFPFIGHFLDFVSPKNTLTIVSSIKSETGLVLKQQRVLRFLEVLIVLLLY